MAGVAQLQRQLVEYRHSLFDEGILGDYFKQLEQLQDESGPDFVIQVATSFNNDSENHLHKLTEALEQESVDFEKVVYHVLKLKGSSSWYLLGLSIFYHISCVVIMKFIFDRYLKLISALQISLLN
ncbi:hypothetical protein CFOL_v3_36480 [Cephalotus follicularis]|uniref:Histidine-containing phosphotransfer protein n=1 Tax=Cephalotus follicularis TaxID=3775 RepID=A0A1Q3DKW6_CEPFO|nr:hypothetical protein CFOL_v3_36480 [Cephalotus follicularis]